MSEREQVVAFLRRWATRTAAMVETLPYGAGLFNPSIPHVWDFNLVWVDAVPATLGAETLVRDAERVHTLAGVAHRHVMVADERGGEALRHGLVAAGYGARRYVLMVQRRQPEQRRRDAAVVELDVEAIVRFSEAGLRGDPEPMSEETIAEILESKRIVARAGARFYGVYADGEVASACDLYLDEDLAQIEAVMTLEQHRNRGYARAVITRAAEAARAVGARVVFLEAEEDDWPKELYRTLGFDTVGFLYVFLRKPPS